MSYCDFVKSLTGSNKAFHKNYHDFQYGFPLHDNNELFGRLILEINQAGLSWEIILIKEAGFREAYHNFDIATVAGYTEDDRIRLLNDAGIIRNKLKVNAAIENAKTILELQKEYESFENWLKHHHPKSKEEWVKLFKKTFKFTGGEIVGEFLMSIGYLPGAHQPDCPIYAEVIEQKPIWMDSSR